MIEQEALELHSIMLTSKPPLIYWLPETLKVMHAVIKWRQEGLQVYFTINTGQNIHLICREKDLKKVMVRIKELSVVIKTIINNPSRGADLTTSHLF